MNEDIECSFPAINSSEGFYFSVSNNNLIQISTMEIMHKENCVKHLLKIFKHLEKSKYSSVTGIQTFYDKTYGEKLANKLIELGLKVDYIDDQYSIDISAYR